MSESKFLYFIVVYTEDSQSHFSIEKINAKMYAFVCVCFLNKIKFKSVLNMLEMI